MLYLHLMKEGWKDTCKDTNWPRPLSCKVIGDGCARFTLVVPDWPFVLSNECKDAKGGLSRLLSLSDRFVRAPDTYIDW